MIADSRQPIADSWLLTLAAVAVVVVAAFATARLIPDDWVNWARLGKHLLILPAVGIGVGFFVLGKAGLKRLGLRVLRSDEYP